MGTCVGPCSGIKLLFSARLKLRCFRGWQSAPIQCLKPAGEDMGFLKLKIQKSKIFKMIIILSDPSENLYIDIV